MAIENTFSKLFIFPNIFFTGIPFLTAFALIFYSMGIKSIDPRYMMVVNTFGYASLMMHTLNDLNNDDQAAIITAGTTGYVAVGMMVMWLAFKEMAFGRH